MLWEQQQIQDLLGWERMLRDPIGHLLWRGHRDGGNADRQVLRSPLNNVGYFAFVCGTQQKVMEAKRKGISE